MSIPRQLQPVPTDELIQKLYIWVDQVPLSRPKRSIARDFSDGVLVAEIVAHFQPGYVELHNYANSSSFTQKMFNWNTLNMKPLKKLGISLNPKDMEDCANVCLLIPSRRAHGHVLLVRTGSDREGVVQGAVSTASGSTAHK